MDLNKFYRYKKNGKVQALSKSKEIWMYTRVSSKEQTKKKYSIEGQINNIRDYARLHGYTITKEHGGTYESATGDFTRKEFKQLFDSVKKARRKPYAIAIKFISRFSRSGGGAISLVEELVNNVGVHLIETSTGLTTKDEKDRLEIYDKLLASKRENMVRLERTLPALKDFLEDGFWLGRPPKGYTMFGERVTNFENRREGQKIEINEVGKILRKAWKWKAEGMTDADIRYKLLDKFHYKISKQNLSAMWRKPFYVGVNTNAMLDAPVKGNWPPLVTEKIWDQVQKRLDGGNRKSGYEKAPVSKHRPLTGFIYCSQCGAAITSYIAKKKQVHYYKCQHGKGGNMNAYTTPRSRKPGVNNSFIEFLSKFDLDNSKRRLLQAQIEKLIDEHTNEKKNSARVLKKELNTLELKLDKVNEKFLLSDSADESTYEKVKTQLENDIRRIKSQLEDNPEKLSNQVDLINSALDFCQNISAHWASGDIHQKLKIQKTLFPEGLVINPETRQYRTKKINGLLSAIGDIARDSESKDNKKSHRKGGLSYLVAGTGLEPVTFGL
ncbi:recombinase family protein [Christiangramia sp. SM2212]|uniref:Recombinase family protein n=1 Tax=Christiangramia sediminicola TaxID=3073267 RepID=A0ABU1EUN5_9FLAO|nr:recombinase family protein [Christiangramia sp. SM2212]MDR5591893.1 recombinase family protein [Christiangramia sp. SM2212]